MTKNSLGRTCLPLVAFSLMALSALAADYDATYSGRWRNSDDIVAGWDWTYPPGIAPEAGSGIFNLNSSVPQDFPGNHLKQVNAQWRELEPVEGKYDFSSILKELNDTNYDGVMLNVRGMVTAIEDANGIATSPTALSAPTWLSNKVPQTQEALKYGVRITNMHIYDPIVKSKLLSLIGAIGTSGIPGNPRLKGQIIHGVSSTKGEEWTGTQASRPEAVAAMEDIIVAWSKAYGSNAKKLAWLGEDPVSLFDAAVIRGGMGVRNGLAERWLRANYTPGGAGQTGQIYDGGYLLVDEAFPPIAQGRYFGDENEEYVGKVFTSPDRLQQNYRLATLRMLQMRRNIVWTERDSTVNPRLLNWMSLELGRSAKSAPDAWVALIRTWTRYNGDKEINNLERWLYQREDADSVTTPTLRMDHSFNVAGNDLLDPSLWYVDLARSGKRIGIAIDDRFLAGGPHTVAIKVTYFDATSKAWSLEYSKGDGTLGTKTIQGNATGSVRTATFFLNNFSAPKTGYNFDLVLRSADGSTPFMFVRVIKLEVPLAPEAPANVVVE